MGPLAGIHIIEMEGIGPGPMAAMLLADMGASVLRIARPDPGESGIRRELRHNLLMRNRDALELDLKRPEAVALALRLITRADALIEGFRPGVMERLGLGPDACLGANPRLVYGRMTGWGQEGPLARTAGHDINYLALSGALHAVGRAGQAPAVPLTLAGDFGGGALYLAMGLLAALLEASRSGHGQVVDAAVIDGAASLTTAFHGLLAAGLWKEERGRNIVDSGAPFYDVYPCSDQKWISIGPLEGRFFAQLLRALELPEELAAAQRDPGQWPTLRTALGDRFLTRTRTDWCARLEGTDVCFAPVLSFSEAPAHPHARARETFMEIEGIMQPAPAPRFSRSVAPAPTGPRKPLRGSALAAALKDWLPETDIQAALDAGILQGDPAES